MNRPPRSRSANLKTLGEQVAAPRPVIAFQGSQGYLKVPCSATAGCRDPRTFRFTFYLSRYTKEQPQASFDCVRQASTRWLEGRGAIQEKITICAMVVEASKSRWGVERLACRRAAAAFPNPETGTLLPRRAASESPSGKGKGSSPPTNEPPWPPVQVLEGRDQRAKKLLGLLERPQLQAEMGQLSPPERSYSLKEDCLQPRKEAWTGALQQHQEASEHLRRKEAQQASAKPFPSPPSEKLAPSQGGSPLRARLQPLRAALGPRSRRWQGPHFTGAESSWWGRKMQPAAAVKSRAQTDSSDIIGEVQSSDEEPEAGSHRAPEVEWPGEEERQADHASTSEENLNYYLKYVPICSVKQYRAYQEDFTADYTTYRHLHARIGSVSRRFAQLGKRLRRMQQGTKEYKVLEDQILQEYRHFKKVRLEQWESRLASGRVVLSFPLVAELFPSLQVYPNYQEEKRHCEYLHHKLSHIKAQILNFEQNVPPAGQRGCGERR
nr:RNA polymerase II elongation factor ELL3 isoform X1 [Zootoca vivipara]